MKSEEKRKDRRDLVKALVIFALFVAAAAAVHFALLRLRV